MVILYVFYENKESIVESLNIVEQRNVDFNFYSVMLKQYKVTLSMYE